MREYGRIRTGFWNHPKIRACSDRAKLLANYLMTGPHSNACGAYLLPDAYVSDDLGWDMKAVAKTFGELFKIGFCERFADMRHIVVCDFLDWNPIENPNVGKAILKQIEQLPFDQAIRHLETGLEQYANQFPNGFGTVFERLRELVRIPVPLPKPKPEPKPEVSTAIAVPERSEPDQAFEAFNEAASKTIWPQAQLITSKRKAAMRKRLAQCGGLAGWIAAMGKALESDFLTGRCKRKNGHENWTPDIDFFLQEQSFAKLMEGSYDNRTSEADAFAAAGDEFESAAAFPH